MMDILPDIRQAKDFVDKAASNGFIGTAATTVLSAMTGGTRSATISTAAQTTNDIRFLLTEFNRKGYKAQIGAGNTLLVSW